jgi:FMN phosphatase YigB (HAD superfamily)
MKPVEAVFFDLDETLLDDNTSFLQSISGACSELVTAISGVSHDLLFESYQSLSQAYWLEIEQQVVRGALDGENVRLETWRRTLSACGCEDQSLARTALDAYSRHRSASYKLFDDAQEVLDELEARLPLALITNGASYTQWDKVKATGIERYFDVVLVSGDVGVGKPDAVISACVG